ncbi:MAG: hypothetical protein ABH827_02660 [bacterium]
MIKSYKKIIIILGAGIFAGIFFFLLNRDYLVIKWIGGSSSAELDTLKIGVSVARKKVQYFFYKDHVLARETGTIVWAPDNITKSFERLIGDWLICLQDQKLISRTVFLRSVAFSFGSEEIFLNFNQSFFPKHVSIMYKWHIIEALLKTLYSVSQSTSVPVQGVRFFVGDEVLHDAHLDFSKAWPITGFLQ